MSVAHDLQPDAAGLLSRISVPWEGWTPELRAQVQRAPLAVVELEGVGHAFARVLGRRGHHVRLHVGEKGVVSHQVVLVHIEGEDRARWVSAERIVLSGVTEVRPVDRAEQPEDQGRESSEVAAVLRRQGDVRADESEESERLVSPGGEVLAEHEDPEQSHHPDHDRSANNDGLDPDQLLLRHAAGGR